MKQGGILGCGKHFPGHGDTTTDSHLELPIVDADRARLDAVELAPFRAAIAEGIPALMSAHVVYPALAPSQPATLSRAIATDLLRGELGFQGVLVSDDLEMRAVADRHETGELAVLAIEAGCDLLLVCSGRESAHETAFEALVRRADRDDGFRARCEEACARVLAMKRSCPAKADYAAFLALTTSDEARSASRSLAELSS
jgi:beta-N-acetylhexosaminidase